MNEDIETLLETGSGVTTRRLLLGAVRDHVLDHALRAGHLVPLHRGVYVRPGTEENPTVRLRAALAYAGPVAALSHVTALHAWGLSTPSTPPVHVVVPVEVRPRGDAAVRVHRWRDFRLEPPLVVTREGLPLVRLERCLVDAWPLLPDGPDRRAALLEAVGERRTTAARARDALRAVPSSRTGRPCAGSSTASTPAAGASSSCGASTRCSPAGSSAPP